MDIQHYPIQMFRVIPSYSWVKGNQVGFGYYLNFSGRIWILRKHGLYWKNLNLFLHIVTLFLSTNLFLCPVFISPLESLFHLRLTVGMLFFFSFILFFTALCFSIPPCVNFCCNFLVWFNFQAHLMYEIYGGLARVGCSKMPIWSKLLLAFKYAI